MSFKDAKQAAITQFPVVLDTKQDLANFFTEVLEIVDSDKLAALFPSMEIASDTHDPKMCIAADARTGALLRAMFESYFAENFSQEWITPSGERVKPTLQQLSEAARSAHESRYEREDAA